MPKRNQSRKACVLSLALLSTLSSAQEMAAEEQAMIERMMSRAGDMIQWGPVVHYRVVGQYKGSPNVSSDPNWMALADVTDRVEFSFEWDITESKLVSAPKLQNAKSTVANMRNWQPKCETPTAAGTYEHADLKSVAQGIGAVVDLNWETSHPPVGVPQFCSGAPKHIPAAKRMHTYQLMVLAPTVLSMPSSGDVKIASDKKSFSVIKHEWVWTFTPTNK